MFDMCHVRSSVTFITVFCLFCLCSSQDICTKINDCACRFTNGSIIDLSSLGYKNGTPRFVNVPDTKTPGYVYFYNPCYVFDMDVCKGASICQKNTNSTEYYNVGSPPTTFFMKESQIIVNYTSPDDKRISSVKLVCAETESLTMEGEGPSTNYTFTFQSKCACANGCSSGSNVDEGLSTGSVLVILLFVFVLCYLLGGIVFQKIMKGATGRELFPNYEFWMDFPLLVRDGVIFTCNGCQNEVSYERI